MTPRIDSECAHLVQAMSMGWSRRGGLVLGPAHLTKGYGATDEASTYTLPLSFTTKDHIVPSYDMLGTSILKMDSTPCASTDVSVIGTHNQPRRKPDQVKLMDVLLGQEVDN